VYLQQRIYILLYIYISRNNWWLFKLSVNGNLVKRLRLEAGLTQKQLAELVGVSQAHIAKIELAKVDPRLSTVNKIMEVLRAGREKQCKDVMTEAVIFARPTESVLEASETMVKRAVSQLPILDRGRVVGTITEENIVRNLKSSLSGVRVTEIMGPPLPVVPEVTLLNQVRGLLENSAGVLISRGRTVVGIITRSDLLKTVR
jgi:predicted transcriptional regulator